MAEKTTVIIIHETILQSWGRDLGAFALFLSLIGLGWLIDSSAMQWVGAIIAFIALFQRASGKVQKLSIADAREKLDALEREAAGG